MMRSLIFKSVLCFALFGFSIMMPAQNLPVLQKDGSVTTGNLTNGISYYLLTNPSMKGVADFALVRKGVSDTLSARKELSSLPHFNRTIPYKFLSRKGIGRVGHHASHAVRPHRGSALPACHHHRG